MNNSIQYYQYKNASFLGQVTKINIQTPHSYPQNNNANTFHHAISIRPFASSFLSVKSPSKHYRQVREGSGVAIDDQGHLLLAQWRDSKINGYYLLYKPNLIQQIDSNKFYNGLFQYGSMKDDRLQGQNYLYHDSGNVIKACFKSNTITGKCYVYNNHGTSQNSRESNKGNEIYQCQVIDVDQPKQNKVISESKGKIQSIVRQTVQRRQLLEPVEFLNAIVRKNQLRHQGKGLISFKINQVQSFFGILKGQKLNSQYKSASQSSSSVVNPLFNGLGVIFSHNWPIKYGQFTNGKLQGLGRLYQTQMNILDGIFYNQMLLQGFLLDHFNNQMHFGKQIQSEGKDDKFTIEQSFRCEQIEYLREFKRQYHLKSLHFKNSYFQMPKIVESSPWPLSIINKLYRNNTMYNIIVSYINPVFESNQRIHKDKGDGDDRQKQEMISLTKRKRSKEGVDVHSNVELLSNLKNISRRNHQFNNYVRQYNIIQTAINILETRSRSKQKIIANQGKSIKHQTNTGKSRHPKAHNTKNASNLFKQSIHNLNQKVKPSTKGQAKSDQQGQVIERQGQQIGELQSLIEQYNRCQSVKGKERGNEYVRMQSKHELMRQDHEVHYPLSRKERKGKPEKADLNKLQVMPLDKIYRQCLNN